MKKYLLIALTTFFIQNTLAYNPFEEAQSDRLRGFSKLFSEIFFADSREVKQSKIIFFLEKSYTSNKTLKDLPQNNLVILKNAYYWLSQHISSHDSEMGNGELYEVQMRIGVMHHFLGNFSLAHEFFKTVGEQIQTIARERKLPAELQMLEKSILYMEAKTYDKEGDLRTALLILDQIEKLPSYKWNGKTETSARFFKRKLRLKLHQKRSSRTRASSPSSWRRKTPLPAYKETQKE